MKSAICVKIDPGHTYGIHSVVFLKPGVTTVAPSVCTCKSITSRAECDNGSTICSCLQVYNIESARETRRKHNVKRGSMNTGFSLLNVISRAKHNVDEICIIYAENKKKENTEQL